MAKVLANRLREVIGDLVNPFHSIFIPGKQLAKGAIVVGEFSRVAGEGYQGFMWKVNFVVSYCLWLSYISLFLYSHVREPRFFCGPNFFTFKLGF